MEKSDSGDEDEASSEGFQPSGSAEEEEESSDYDRWGGWGWVGGWVREG
jgi:hypothetical protein